VIAVSYARIHRQNLVNAGILPLIFDNSEEIQNISQGDMLYIKNIHEGLRLDRFEVKNESRGTTFMAHHGLSQRQIEIILGRRSAKCRASKAIEPVD